MKCFLVVNQPNNPVFLDFDAEFTKFIHKKAVEIGLVNAEDVCDSEEVDMSVVTQLFSPLVLSQVPLDDQVQNPCTSIVCPDGLLLVFRKVDDVQYITISGDEEDNVQCLQKKILVFIQLTKFLFGPVYMEIANCGASERAARWSFLRSVLHTWTHLVTTDHTFLVEATEHLHVNQMVSEKCVGLLERTVSRMQASADQASQHAFLLVDTKLLALYSKRSAFKLQPADILLTTLLTQDMFPSNHSLEEFMASTPSTPLQPPTHTDSGSQVGSARRLQDSSSRSLQDSEGRSPGCGGGGGDAVQGGGGGKGGGGREPDNRTSDDNEEFHSAPTTPSQRSPTPDTDADAISSLLASTTGQLLDGDDDDNNDDDDAGDDAHRHLSGAGGGEDRDGGLERDRDGGLERDRDGGLESDRDGGLERLIPSQTAKPGSGGGGSVSSGQNRESTTGSSIVEMEFPPLSCQDSSGVRPQLSALVLSGRLSASDFSQRSHSSTADARHSDGRHSDGSRKTPSEHSLVTDEGGSTGGGTGARSRSSTGPGGDYYWPHTVFLQTPACSYTPHTLHCAQVLPGISLVVVSQMAGQSAADLLCQVISIVQDLLQARRNKLSRTQALHVHTVITDLLAKVTTTAKKFKRRVQNSSADVKGRWEGVEMREKLITYLLQDEHLPMLPDLESTLFDLQRRLKELFHLFFLAPGRLGGGGADGGEGGSQGEREMMSRLKARLQKELMDYRDYLGVKAQRNITMTSYLDEFPGLIHFIYVDRQFHQMISPSFNLMSDQGRNSATVFLKDQVWRMYSYMVKRLQQGYTTVLLREGDFYFSFFLWFEDSSGNPLSVQEPFKPGLDTPIPGILTGSFYKRLLRQCFPQRMEGAVHCYEMFMMHLGLLTPPTITTHCQTLAHRLWQMSGEAYTPINLL